MKTSQMTVLSRIFAILMFLGLLLAPASSVFASSGGTSFTQTFHNATDSFVMPVPCRNYLGTVNITYNGVFHVNVNNAGDFWMTGTQAGTFVAAPLDPSNPTFTGHFAVWFGQSQNNQNLAQTSTFNVIATGSDGSTINFHDTAHFSVSASGLVETFDKPVCG